MMLVRHTYLQMLIALIALMMPTTPAYASEEARFEQRSVATSSDDATQDGSTLKSKGLDIIAIAIEQQSVDSSPQAYRQTQRTNLRSANSHINTCAVRAVNSGVRAHIYGLSNHRVLFSLLARHYYINGLRRLII